MCARTNTHKHLLLWANAVFGRFVDYNKMGPICFRCRDITEPVTTIEGPRWQKNWNAGIATERVESNNKTNDASATFIIICIQNK